MSVGAIAFTMRIFGVLFVQSTRTENLEHLIPKDDSEEQSSKLNVEGLVFSGGFLMLLPQVNANVVKVIDTNFEMVLDGEILMNEAIKVFLDRGSDTGHIQKLLRRFPEVGLKDTLPNLRS